MTMPGTFKPDERQAHGHAVVVISLDRRPMERCGRYRQAVRELHHTGADAAQLGGQRGQAVGLFMANVGDVANRRWPRGEAGNRAQRHDGVADVVHVHVHAAKRAAVDL